MPVFRNYAGTFMSNFNNNFFDFLSGYLPLLIKEIPEATHIALHPNKKEEHYAHLGPSHESETFLILINGAPRGIITICYTPYTDMRGAGGGYVEAPAYQDHAVDDTLPDALRKQVQGSFDKKDVEEAIPIIHAKWCIQIRDTCTSKPEIFEGYPEDLDKIEEAYKYLVATLAKNNQEPNKDL